MNFRQLESFIQVSTLKSFSKAAEQLYLTQPTISAHISQLEKELGVDLLNRTTKNIALTPNGKKLFDYAKEIIDIKEHIIDEFNPRPKAKTVIKISASTIPFQYILPSLLVEFQNKYGRTDFELTESNSLKVMDNLKHHEADIGFTGKKPETSDFLYAPVCDDRLLLVTPASPRYLQLKEEGAKLKDFLKEPFIMRESGSGTRLCAESFFMENGVSPSDIHTIATMDNNEAIRNSCINGLGISFMSELSVEKEINDGRLLCFPFPSDHLNRKIYMVWNHTRNHSSFIREFSSIISVNKRD